MARRAINVVRCVSEPEEKERYHTFEPRSLGLWRNPVPSQDCQIDLAMPNQLLGHRQRDAGRCEGREERRPLPVEINNNLAFSIHGLPHRSATLVRARGRTVGGPNARASQTWRNPGIRRIAHSLLLSTISLTPLPSRATPTSKALGRCDGANSDSHGKLLITANISAAIKQFVPKSVISVTRTPRSIRALAERNAGTNPARTAISTRPSPPAVARLQSSIASRADSASHFSLRTVISPCC